MLSWGFSQISPGWNNRKHEHINMSALRLSSFRSSCLTILMSMVCVLFPKTLYKASIASRTFSPSTMWPKTTCFPSSHGHGASLQVPCQRVLHVIEWCTGAPWLRSWLLPAVLFHSLEWTTAFCNILLRKSTAEDCEATAAPAVESLFASVSFGSGVKHGKLDAQLNPCQSWQWLLGSPVHATSALQQSMCLLGTEFPIRANKVRPGSGPCQAKRRWCCLSSKEAIVQAEASTKCAATS